MQCVHESGNPNDPYCIAILTTSENLVGHLPREISRFAYFFMKRGGTLSAHVVCTKRQRSPIEQGGLEIIITLKAYHSEQHVLDKLDQLTTKHQERYKKNAEAVDVNSYSKIWTAPKSKRANVITISDDDNDEPIIIPRKRTVTHVIESDVDSE